MTGQIFNRRASRPNTEHLLERLLIEGKAETGFPWYVIKIRFISHIFLVKYVGIKHDFRYNA